MNKYLQFVVGFLAGILLILLPGRFLIQNENKDVPISDHYRVILNPALDQRLPNVKTAFKSWEVAEPGLTFDLVVSDVINLDDHTIILRPTAPENLVRDDGVVQLGLTVRDSRHDSAGIVIDNKISQKLLYPVALHEIGHALGLHHGSKNSLMDEYAKVGGEITCEDRQQFAIVRGRLFIPKCMQPEEKWLRIRSNHFPIMGKAVVVSVNGFVK